MFARMGIWCFRNRGKVGLLWLAVLVAAGGLASAQPEEQPTGA